MLGLRHAGVTWPEEKSFAFSIFDDTDNATVENIRPVYALLNELGIKITKTVWPLRSDPGDRFFSQSLQNQDYLDFILELQASGFEIGYHGARGGSNPRQITLEALDLFREKLGHDPYAYAHHAPALENLYWGGQRTRWSVLKPFTSYCSQHQAFYGSTQGSRYFWGDLCRARIRYVRNYGFTGANLLTCDPWTPYHDPRKPFVNAWFSTNGWMNADSVEQVFNPTHIDQWERSRGLVIIGGHLGQHFARDGKVNPSFEKAMRSLAVRNGWFVPVSTILDHISTQRGVHVLSAGQSRVLELRWAMHMGKKLLRSRL